MQKFKFGQTIRRLRRTKTSVAKRTFELIRLIVWATLDQKVGREARRADNARQAGLFAQLASGNASNREQKLIIEFADHDALEALLMGPSASELLKMLREKIPEFQYLIAIVDFLIRAQQQKLDAKLRTGAFAVQFAIKHNEKCQRDFGTSKVTQLWEKYAPSAPIIYAAALLLKEQDDFRADNPVVAYESIKRFCADERRLALFLGYASYAAKVLPSSKVFKMALGHVDPIAPPLQPFSADELSSIAAGIASSSTQHFQRVSLQLEPAPL